MLRNGKYHYLHLDVFTDRPLTGNQLAVFLDAQGLDADVMQRIALEMAFSETTFVFPAEHPTTDYRVRIFTPRTEIPMAGHPTVGTTFALAHAGRITKASASIMLGLGIGRTPVGLEWGGDQLDSSSHYNLGKRTTRQYSVECSRQDSAFLKIRRLGLRVARWVLT